ncbi:MAG: cupin domain-containing protein [Rhizobiales bacterium]|nr:cupin domain-containing protein [Hyphomicrobiales bacterium]
MNSKNEMKGRLVKSGGSVRGKQGLDYHVGISADTVGSKAIHMQTVIIAPGSRAHAHKHTTHETAIYALSGTSGVYHGEKLEHHTFVAPGDYFYIPADVPHLPYNPSETETVIAVIARTDPNEQESVVLMPELEKLVPQQFKSPPTAPKEDQKELFETAAP